MMRNSLYAALVLVLVLWRPAAAQDNRGGSRGVRTLQEMIDAVPRHGGTVYLPRGRYLLPTTLNLRGRRNVRIVGEGPEATRLVASFPPGQDDMPVIDMTGAHVCGLEHLSIETGAGRASVGLLLARAKGDGPGGNPSSGLHYFERVLFSGRYTKAAVYSIASEVNTFVHCQFTNRESGGHCFFTSSQNDLGVTTPCRTPHEGIHGGSNVSFNFLGCTWAAWAAGSGADTGTEVCLYAMQSGEGQTEDIRIYGGDFSAGSSDYSNPNKGALAGIRLDSWKIQQVTVDGVRFETGGARNAIRVDKWAYGLQVRNCKIDSREAAISAVTLVDSIIENNRFANFALYPVAGREAQMEFRTIRNCRIDYSGVLNPLARDNERYPPRAIRITHEASGSDLRVRSTRDVLLPALTRGTIVEAINEDGAWTRRRIEYGTASQPAR